MALVLYLIGCDHRNAQNYGKNTTLGDRRNQTQLQFKKFLLDCVLRYRPVVLCEENNEDIMQRTGQQSVVAEVASELGIRHIHCDPTLDERYRLFIGEDLPFLGPAPSSWMSLIKTIGESYSHDIAHRWPIREEFWVGRLGKHLNSTVLFVCGDAHRWTFRRRLESRGIQVTVVGKRIGAKPLNETFFNAYRSVRRFGFPPETGCFCISPVPNEPINIS